ncbi:MAG: hypothetical protein K0S56_1043 [Microvirga sp.]|jgi:hypothetical protein|nr:hypothetical protein [Microvirga sp.]
MNAYADITAFQKGRVAMVPDSAPLSAGELVFG